MARLAERCDGSIDARRVGAEELCTLSASGITFSGTPFLSAELLERFQGRRLRRLELLVPGCAPAAELLFRLKMLGQKCCRAWLALAAAAALFTPLTGSGLCTAGVCTCCAASASGKLGGMPSEAPPDQGSVAGAPGATGGTLTTISAPGEAAVKKRDSGLGPTRRGRNSWSVRHDGD